MGTACPRARALKLHLPGHHLGDLARSAAGWARAAGRRGLRFELRARGRVRRERGVVSVDVAGHGVRALLVGPAADAAASRWAPPLYSGARDDGQNAHDFCALPFLAKAKRSIGTRPAPWSMV